MTQEERQLLFKDLCARLPYGVVVRCTDTDTDYKCFLTTDILNELLHNIEYYDYKPYLRPMSSMTDEEIDRMWEIYDSGPAAESSVAVTGYLYERGLDCHHLIEKGLALEAPEGMYKSE